RRSAGHPSALPLKPMVAAGRRRSWMLSTVCYDFVCCIQNAGDGNGLVRVCQAVPSIQGGGEEASMITQSLPWIAPTAGDTSWFVRDRFGLFVHWGLYALPARHEWVRNRERITNEDYQKYFDHFDPDLYDPAAWARAAKQAGMRYAVLTTKHHEGFCLWDSALTDYKATNTPAGRDLVRPWVEAFRAEGLRIGFYHSLIDWHHPEFPVDFHHPQRDDEEFKAANANRDVRKYAAYLHGQVRE